MSTSTPSPAASSQCSQDQHTPPPSSKATSILSSSHINSSPSSLGQPPKASNGAVSFEKTTVNPTPPPAKKATSIFSSSQSNPSPFWFGHPPPEMPHGAASFEETIIDQLRSTDENRLLDAIDELRSQGVGKLLGEEGLPQIIVCGDQSSGKSSVLEALTRVRFPTKSSVCTTFPTELRLRREPKSRISCRIKPGTGRSAEDKKRFETFQQLYEYDVNISPEKFSMLVEFAQIFLNGTGKNENSSSNMFCDDILEIEIIGPKLAPLTIVDLPGLIHYRNGLSGNRDVELVSSLVDRYMKNDNSIILAVISAHNDISNQVILSQIKNLKNEFGRIDVGHRTLGIITKPDELPSGSEKEQEYLDFARLNPEKFRYGWHVVRNRSYSERSSTFEERDDKEKDFFRNSNWNSLPRRDVGLGIENLRQKLSKMLLEHITLSLPAIVDCLTTDLKHGETQLHKLGPTRSTPKEHQNYLYAISDEFSECARDALDGRYRQRSFFGDANSTEGLKRRLRANIRILNDRFAETMLEKGHKWHVIEDKDGEGEGEGEDKKDGNELHSKPNGFTSHANPILRSAFLKYHVDKLALNERGNELPGIPNPHLIGSLFRQQSEPWEKIASDHLDSVWKAVKTFLETLLAHLAEERTCNQLLIQVIDPAMDERLKSVKAKLEELLTTYREDEPLSIAPQFSRRIWAKRNNQLVLSFMRAMVEDCDGKDKDHAPSLERVMSSLNSDRDGLGSKLGSLETYEFMQTFYDDSILIFINNVASLAIEQCLLRGLPKIFSSAAIRDMDDEKLAIIASESQDMIDERDRLTERVKILKKGLQTIRTIQPNTRMSRTLEKPAQTAPFGQSGFGMGTIWT